MPPHVASLAPGSLVGGDFRVVSPLSAGGMGAVYVSEQLSTGKRRALKVMHPSLVSDPSLRERFAQEARVGSMIASDHVVQVVGAGVDPQSGAPWLAMELLDGENLAAYVARHGPLGVGELLEILRPLCHALGAAHVAGVVHRDVKPENVFLARTQSMSAPMVVKVLDFGIAKLVAQAAASTANMGTPLWMAPEQSDSHARISPATDVWAVGLLAFWLLTGRYYWKSVATGTASVHSLLREILFEPVVPASQRAHELGLGQHIPPGFDGWFGRCLAKEPSARFADANAAIAELSAALGVSMTFTFAPASGPVATGFTGQLSAMTPAQPVSQSGPGWAPVSAQSSSFAAPRRSSGGLAVFVVLGLLLIGGGVVAAAAYWYVDSEDSPIPLSALSGTATQPAPSSSARAPAPKPSAAPAPSGATR